MYSFEIQQFHHCYIVSKHFWVRLRRLLFLACIFAYRFLFWPAPICCFQAFWQECSDTSCLDLTRSSVLVLSLFSGVTFVSDRAGVVKIFRSVFSFLHFYFSISIFCSFWIKIEIFFNSFLYQNFWVIGRAVYKLLL